MLIDEISNADLLTAHFVDDSQAYFGQPLRKNAQLEDIHSWRKSNVVAFQPTKPNLLNRPMNH